MKVLKTRYFPKCKFLEVKKGPCGSWLWSSIMEGRKVLSDNVLLSIGERLLDKNLGGPMGD